MKILNKIINIFLITVLLMVSFFSPFYKVKAKTIADMKKELDERQAVYDEALAQKNLTESERKDIKNKIAKNEEKVVELLNENEKLNEENMSEYLDKTNKIVGMYTDITDKSIDILSKSIIKVVMPDGRVVDNPEFIREYIKNVSSELIVKLNEAAVKLNEYGIKQTLEMKCSCCGHVWDEKFYGFNQSDFFGISS